MRSQQEINKVNENSPAIKALRAVISSLPKKECMVYGKILYMIFRYPRCYVSQRTLGVWLGLWRQKVNKHAIHLGRLGLLRIHSGKALCQTNVYQLPEGFKTPQIIDTLICLFPALLGLSTVNVSLLKKQGFNYYKELVTSTSLNINLQEKDLRSQKGLGLVTKTTDLLPSQPFSPTSTPSRVGQPICTLATKGTTPVDYERMKREMNERLREEIEKKRLESLSSSSTSVRAVFEYIKDKINK